MVQNLTDKQMATKGAFGDTKKKDNVKTAAEIESSLKTGKNIYVGDAKAAEKRGKKRFGYWSCTQCHGPTAKGTSWTRFSRTDISSYPKDATNVRVCLKQYGMEQTVVWAVKVSVLWLLMMV